MSYRKLYLLMLLCISTAVLSAVPKDTITWLTRNFPPTFINEGKFSGLGSTQVETQMIQKMLPEYTHLAMEANIDRMTLMMKSGKKICRGALIKTPEREQYMYMSIPHNFYPAVRLYFAKENLLKFKKHIQNGKISLESVMKDKALSMAIESGRSYGTSLDPIVNKYGKQENVLSRKFSDTEGTIAMLLHKRFDYMIEFPFSIGYYLKKQDIKKNVLQGVPIAEMEVEYLLGCYGAPKTEWGRKVIDKINFSLLKLRATSEYRKTMELWLEDDILPDYRKKYDSDFLPTR